MSGPFESEQQVRDTQAMHALYATFRADPGVGHMAPHVLAMLEGACAAARVELGAFDRRVLAWLAQWEPETCMVIAGLITRAHAGGASCSPRLSPWTLSN